MLKSICQIQKHPAMLGVFSLEWIIKISYSISFQERPSRVIMATDATGPQVPA